MSKGWFRTLQGPIFLEPIFRRTSGVTCRSNPRPKLCFHQCTVPARWHWYCKSCTVHSTTAAANATWFPWVWFGVGPLTWTIPRIRECLSVHKYVHCCVSSMFQFQCVYPTLSNIFNYNIFLLGFTRIQTVINYKLTRLYCTFTACMFHFLSMLQCLLW